MRAVEARKLCLRFGAVHALRDLDLEVAEGERVAVVGDNGAGKTTLLRLLATASRPSSGELRLLGLDADRDRNRLRRDLGYVAHEPGLYPQLTARENLEFFCTLHGVPPHRAGEVLEMVGLASLADRHTASLSRGERQRVALGRSILHDPRLLILDEPDSSLDEGGRELLGELARGRTLVMATHDQALAAAICSRVVRLGRGRIQEPALKLEVVG